jgi:hypothetical protein
MRDSPQMAGVERLSVGARGRWDGGHGLQRSFGEDAAI